MPQYVITRKMNGREYYLENLDSEDKATWVTNKKNALQFEHEYQLREFVADTFPGKDYYVTMWRPSDDWGIIAKPKGFRIR